MRNKSRKIFDPKAQTEHFSILNAWCGENRLFVRSNQEVFFINERILMKPEFIINENIYIDIVLAKQIDDKYLKYCELFSQSYGTIIVIPKEIISNITNITKKDLEQAYGIKF